VLFIKYLRVFGYTTYVYKKGIYYPKRAKKIEAYTLKGKLVRWGRARGPVALFSQVYITVDRTGIK
jgi:hypothetical protein